MNNNVSNRLPLNVASSIILGAALIGGALILRPPAPAPQSARIEARPAPRLASPAAGAFILPFAWGDLGPKLVSVGVIDEQKFLSLYSGVLREEARRLVEERQDEPLSVTAENAPLILNLLWAAGLGNKSAVLEKGEMANPLYGGTGRFASTAGWSVSSGDPLRHYSRHPFAVLTAEQEALVDGVSKDIFRPCCDNPTHFPDCNHGMAMLGVLELMAAQGASEAELYDTALALNRLWFPAQYQVIDRFVAESMPRADARIILSRRLSSASGFAAVSQELETSPAGRQTGGGCSV